MAEAEDISSRPVRATVPTLSLPDERSPERQPTTDGPASGAEAVGDALRSAVERTLAATAGSATETRDRAQGLLDDVVRRGQSARERVARRGEEATNRLAEAIGELRAADGEDLEHARGRLDAVEARAWGARGRSTKPVGGQSNPQSRG